MANPFLKQGVRRGLAGRCPNCGEGKLFRAYLKVETPCAACSHDNLQYRSDDGPAYLTILIVGHILVAPMLALNFISAWPAWIVLAVTLPLLTVATLVTLPLMKGLFIGLQWSIAQNDRVTDREQQPV